MVAGGVTKDRRTFIKLGIKPRVKRINIISVLLNHWVCIMIQSFGTSFTTYLLKSNYGLQGDEVAEVVGNLGSVGKIGSMIAVALITPAMDLFGRKMLMIGGLALTGLALFAKPLFDHLTALYILTFLADVGIVPALHTPYPVDYVEKGSLGLLTAGYFFIMGQLGTLMSTSSAIQI